jgi:hypothetical protein
VTVRKCQTCKHYEPSPIWRKGWCRNPRLYSPQQSHLVGQDELDCSRGLGNFWEEVEEHDVPDDDVRPNANVASERRPLRLFLSPPRLASATAGVMARSDTGSTNPRFGASRQGSGSGGGGGTPPPPFPEQTRAERGGPPPGPERTVSYQPEERYWTDYLRVALPVVGLLLMLGLFWVWANQLIRDDESNSPPVATATNAGVAVTVAAVPPTAAPTQVVAIGATSQDAVRTPAATTVADAPVDDPTEPAASGEIQEGSVVVVTEDGVNMRPGPSTEEEAVTQLQQGTELQVTGPSVDDGDITWWPVTEPLQELDGYVSADFLELSEDA